MTRGRRVALVLIVAAVLLRLATLSHHSLWLDEAFSIRVATTHSAAEIWTPDFDGMHPSLYYLVLHAFLGVTGVSQVAARLPSALASIVSLVLIYFVGRHLFFGARGRVIGLTAAMLLALAPIDFWYSQEVRMYEMVVMAALTFMFGLALVIDGAWWAVLLIAVGLAGGVNLDHTMWPVAIVATSGWLVLWFHRSRRGGALTRVVIGIGAGLVLAGPARGRAAAVYEGLSEVSLFANVRSALGILRPPPIPFAVAIVGVLIISISIAATMWWIASRPKWTRAFQYTMVGAFVVATMAVVFPRAYSLKQVLVCVWPFLILATAWALSAIERRVFVGAIVVSAAALMATFLTPRADWRGVAAYLSSPALSDAVVVLDPLYNEQPLHFYMPSARPVVRGPVASIEALRPAASASAMGQACLVSERFGAKPPTSSTEEWLDDNLALVSATPFARLEVRCYRPRP